MKLQRHWEHGVMLSCIRQDLSGIPDACLEEVRLFKRETNPNAILSPRDWHYRLYTDNPFFEEIYVAVNNAIKNATPISLLVDCEHIIKVSDRNVPYEEMKQLVTSNCLFVFQKEIDQLFSWSEYGMMDDKYRKYKFWRFLFKTRFRKLIYFELDPYLMFNKTIFDYFKSYENDIDSILEQVANEMSWELSKIREEFKTS